MNYDKLPECDLIDDYVLKRLKKGLYTHVLITGLPGKGKSDFGIRMAERLSARIKNGIDFKHTDIVDSLLGLLDRISKIEKPGEIIMIEEVSVLFPSRRAMSSSNVAVGRILDTIRKKRVILISNAPLYPSIDSHMRSMAEVLVECQGVLRKEELVKAKAWILQTAPHSGKTYRHTFRRGRMKVLFHYAKQSSKEIRQAYEKEKDKFLDQLYARLKAKEEKKIKKENKEIVGGLSDKEKRDRNIWLKYKVDKKKAIDIAREEGLSEGHVYQIIRNIRQNNLFPLEKAEN